MKLVRLDTNEEVKIFLTEMPRFHRGDWYVERATVDDCTEVEFVYKTAFSQKYGIIDGPYYFEWDERWFRVPRFIKDKENCLDVAGLEFKIVEDAHKPVSEAVEQAQILQKVIDIFLREESHRSSFGWITGGDIFLKKMQVRKDKSIRVIISFKQKSSVIPETSELIQRLNNFLKVVTILIHDKNEDYDFDDYDSYAMLTELIEEEEDSLLNLIPNKPYKVKNWDAATMKWTQAGYNVQFELVLGDTQETNRP